MYSTLFQSTISMAMTISIKDCLCKLLQKCEFYVCGLALIIGKAVLHSFGSCLLH